MATWILRQIAEKKIDATILTAHQRRICVRYMLHERKWTQAQIAEILMVHPFTIHRDKKEILEQNSWILDEIDTRAFALELIATAEAASAKLFSKGREKDAWTVQKECVEALQNLGYVKRAPVEFKGHLSLLEILNFGNGNGSKEEEISSSRF